MKRKKEIHGVLCRGDTSKHVSPMAVCSTAPPGLQSARDAVSCLVCQSGQDKAAPSEVQCVPPRAPVSHRSELTSHAGQRPSLAA